MLYDHHEAMPQGNEVRRLRDENADLRRRIYRALVRLQYVQAQSAAPPIFSIVEQAMRELRREEPDHA
jgi:hypothetical protein